MSSQRQLIDDARRALGIKESAPEFTPHEPRQNQPATRGISNATAKEQPAGIASPLTEGTDADTGNPAREYYGTQLKTSSDGLFVLPIKPIKTLNFKDALGNPVVIQLAEPKPDQSGTTP